MQGLTVNQKYSSLLQQGIKGQAEITEIGGKSLELIQRGNSWRGRLVCWVKDNISPLFRKKSVASQDGSLKSQPLRTFREDVFFDQSIGADAKMRMTEKIQRLDQSGIPIRVKHLRQLLKEVNTEKQPMTVKITKTTTGANQQNIGEAADPAQNTRLRNGDTFTVKIDEMVIGGNEYAEALDKCTQGEKDFFDNNLSGTLHTSADNFARENGGGSVDDLDTALHGAWKDAVEQQVEGLHIPAITDSQLSGISKQVITELCDEIKGSRPMNADDLEKVKITKAANIANTAVGDTMTKMHIVPRPGFDDKQKLGMRTMVIVEMQDTKINERGEGRIFLQTPEQALDRAVMNYCEKHQELFFFPK